MDVGTAGDGDDARRRGLPQPPEQKLRSDRGRSFYLPLVCTKSHNRQVPLNDAFPSRL
jgi:hypothetical protein